MKNKGRVVCFGEILWDVFPNKKVIGGAPLNVALRLHSQGYPTNIISKVGDDSEGSEAIQYLKKNKFPLQGIQLDEKLPTGEVKVLLDTQGSATYQITQPVAWDAISYAPEALALVKASEVFVFGSLACRSPQSKETLLGLVKYAAFSVFDVNLRPPFYTEKLLWELFQHSDFVKMNDEELFEITSGLDGKLNDLESCAQWLMEEVQLKGLCVTKGANGAVLFFKGQSYNHSGFKIKVADTVGAGDSFLATLVGALFVDKQSPMEALERACAIGAVVASKVGANCKVNETDIENLFSKKKK